jgi:hypothetical protein
LLFGVVGAALLLASPITAADPENGLAGGCGGYLGIIKPAVSELFMPTNPNRVITIETYLPCE